MAAYLFTECLNLSKEMCEKCFNEQKPKPQIVKHPNASQTVNKTLVLYDILFLPSRRKFRQFSQYQKRKSRSDLQWKSILPLTSSKECLVTPLLRCVSAQKRNTHQKQTKQGPRMRVTNKKKSDS